LEAEHVAAGGRLVPFAGWSLPVQYAGILAEHRAVRTACGVFDISHMGQVTVSGPGAGAWLDGLVSRRPGTLGIGEGAYQFLLNEAGGVLDDLIVYRTGAERWFLVVNAARRESDLAWFAGHGGPGVRIGDRSATHGAIAVQGPGAVAVYRALWPDGPALPERFGIAERDGVILCRTGYTGEDGFELCAAVAELPGWWRRAVAAGAEPCGLGARDLLRLEKGYPLHGNDLTPEHTPLEAGLGWAVDLEAGGFIGAEALRRQRAEGVSRRLVAVAGTGKMPPPRPGYPVHGGEGAGDEPIGVLTSGGWSPARDAGIALAYVPDGWHRPGRRVWIGIRERRYPAVVVAKPFV
jgi:aminomethyltransferase